MTGPRDGRDDSRDEPSALKGNVKRAVLIMDLDAWVLPVAAVHAWTGADVVYLTSHLSSNWARAWVQRMGIMTMDLQDSSEIRLPPSSYAAPMLAAEKLCDTSRLEPLLDYLASGIPNAPHAKTGFRVALLGALGTARWSVLLADMWARSVQADHVTVIPGSRVEGALLRSVETPARIRNWPSGRGAAQRVTSVCRSIWTRVNKRVPAPDSDGGIPRVSSTPVEDATVIFVFNQDALYGALYAYDHLFSDEPSSPLHPANIAFMSVGGGQLSNGFSADAFPSGSGLTRRLLSNCREYWRARIELGSEFPHGWGLKLVASSVRVKEMATQLSARYPRARLAVFAFDIQVPAELSLALEAAGMRTIALHERPATAVDHSAVLVVGTLLTASQYFARAALRSSSFAVAQSWPIGMWRTDLLLQSRREPPPPVAVEARAKGQRLIVALPYHLDPRTALSTNPVTTSPAAVRHFIQSMIGIAEATPDVHVAIRGKNDHWTTDPGFVDLMERLVDVPNISVSREYTRLNESYRLCAFADLVIAKPTSLADEVLSVGTPCILHDFTENAIGYSGTVLGYLPAGLWAHTDEELHERVQWALDGTGATFREWWEPHRRALYGDWSDGHVRQRAQEMLTLEVESMGAAIMRDTER